MENATLTTAQDFTCTVDSDLFEDEQCDYERSDLRDSCPRHERNLLALTRRYVAESVNNSDVYDTAEKPLPQFIYGFRREQLSTDYHGYNALDRCAKWSFDHADITMLWSNGCASDFETALILTMQDGGAEMFELSANQFEMLRHYTRTCSCYDQECHDGICAIECIEAHGIPSPCLECGERHCCDHQDTCA